MPSPAEKPSARPAAELRIAALAGIPLVQPGDDIADLIVNGSRRVRACRCGAATCW